MATGAGWLPPYSTSTSSSKYSPSPTASMFYDGSLTLDYTQDLHLKMSKKIAQLTKVIYALNTKNDEHEEEIESLKDAHEDEVQHIVTETRDKIMQYKSKMVDEADLRRRLASLEESVDLHEHMKRQALAEFEMYRQRMEDSQLCTEAQHTQRVVSMSREVEEMRRDFEEKLRAFSQAQAQFEAEKRRALEDLRATHRQEVEELLNNQQNQSASSTEDQERLAELHRQEVEALMERVEEITKDKVRLVEEFEGKLGKAQEYYERELEAMRRTHQLTTENLLAWKRTEVELRKEFQAQETSLQRSLGKLRSELQKAQEENLHKQLEEAVQDGEIWVMQLKDTEYELEGSRERVQQQATEILHKASQIGSLQATQMSHEATIRSLDQEQSRLKEKLCRLEEEREAVLNQSQNCSEQHKQTVVRLEQSLREEHQGYEKELCQLRSHYEEEMHRFKEAQVRALEELEGKHQKMCQEFEIKRMSLEEQRDRLQQQLDNLKEELSAKLNMANQEVSHLQELVREGQQNMNSAQTQISCLRETQDKLRIELDATRARVRETSNLLTDLQEEIETQRQQHDARVMSIRTEEKQKMDKMADDLDQKWRDALREEVLLLKEELTEEYEADKQGAMTQVSQQKDLEMMASREGWQRKVEDLLEQTLEERLKQEQREEVHALKEAHRRTLDILRQQSDQELQTLRFELEDEGKAKLASLRAELNHLHAASIEHLKQIHLKENSSAKRELEKALEHSQQQEQELIVRISDMQAELCSRSNRITDLDHEIHSLNETISTLTRELEIKGKEVLRVRSEANHQIRAHEQDLSRRHERDLGEISIVHHRETQIILADFNKAQEVLKDKITALQILLEGTEDKLRHRESRPEDLHVIADLREMVTEREGLVKKLVDDKKFYQLELVNRETGFNKVFNSSANVGVINPLIKVSVLLPIGPCGIDTTVVLPEPNATTPPDPSGVEAGKSLECVVKDEDLYSQYFTF
ncbi:Protein FAM184A [Dissostichus eleginoides]|uniref:Protein FAM184A n=1 Tax=Dissostichus eleginoides TaxID=100907 RepID=A0AAD9B5T5_DISEL|nr:Protein FAM184A [Dissostichus eleginoides]